MLSPSVQKLQNLDDFNDFGEIVTAGLEIVEAGFELFLGGSFNPAKLGILFALYGVVKDGVEESKDMYRELGVITDEEFDAKFSEASAGFNLVDNSLEHDIKGVAKGVFHVMRIAAREKMKREAEAA